MSSTKHSRHSDMFIIALLGKNSEFNNTVKNTILNNGKGSDKTLKDFVVVENESFRIISTHDFFDEKCSYPDQKIIDFMAHSYDGLHLFILAIDSENAQRDKVVSQIVKHQNIFGQTVSGDRKCETSETEFNMVLLGLTGTGKSASGNTILKAKNPQLEPKELFESKPSSTPVTTQCQFKMTNLFGRHVRVVDTPDFFDDDTNSQAEVEECKKYCQPGRCVVLLVIQMGRFTDGEKGILERLEEKLGWKIRERTIILLTHGENVKDKGKSFIAERSNLSHIVKACGDRYHVFKNTSKKPKQVKKLFKKIPDYKEIFPESTEKQPLLKCHLG